MNSQPDFFPELVQLAAIVCLAAAVCVGIIRLLRPVLVRHALAQPNARSSHRIPTPQGGGVGVVAATLAVVTATAAVLPLPSGTVAIWWPVGSAVLLLSVIGWVDDVRSLPVLPRLLAHAFAIAIVMLTLPDAVRIVPPLPFWLERVLLFVAGVYLVNIVNFMDGLDWMSVAEFVPICAGIVLVAAFADLPPLASIVAAALGGAVVGFAPFNRPVAKLFLGDVGSLPMGLLLFWLLLGLAMCGQLAAAILLPLYYLMDASLTLMCRIARREPIYQAHRSHFYQRATDLGWSVPAVVAQVFAANVGLAALATLAAARADATSQMIAVMLGVGLVAALLWRFARRPN
jgi:UDP-N-acetylmuramyl pentapeptide phosphotransferase/UDP-N-acetylglucosamine-1-phosphate transferase